MSIHRLPRPPSGPGSSSFLLEIQLSWGLVLVCVSLLPRVMSVAFVTLSPLCQFKLCVYACVFRVWTVFFMTMITSHFRKGEPCSCRRRRWKWPLAKGSGRAKATYRVP